MAVPLYDPDTVDEGALDIVHTLESVHANLVSVYQSYGVYLPARNYWTVGTTAWDCEQATVSLMGGNLGLPGDQATSPLQCDNTPRTITIEISVVRTAALGNGTVPPAPTTIQDKSVGPAVDASILLKNLGALTSLDELGMSPSVITSFQILNAQGGYHGVRMLISMAAY